MTSTTQELEPLVQLEQASAQVLTPHVNLLPPERAERARVRRVQLALGGCLLGTVAAVGGLHLSASAGVRAAADDLASATQAGAALQAQKAEFADVADVHAQAAQAKALLSGALGQEVRYSGLLHGLSRTVPDDVWLKDVTFSQSAAATPTSPTSVAPPPLGQVTFSGVAFAHDDVAEWLEALAGQKGFADPTFSGATTAELGERSVVDFTSTVNLTPDALSGRYAPPEGG